MLLLNGLPPFQMSSCRWPPVERVDMQTRLTLLPILLRILLSLFPSLPILTSPYSRLSDSCSRPAGVCYRAGAGSQQGIAEVRFRRPLSPATNPLQSQWNGQTRRRGTIEPPFVDAFLTHREGDIMLPDLESQTFYLVPDLSRRSTLPSASNLQKPCAHDDRWLAPVRASASWCSLHVSCLTSLVSWVAIVVMFFFLC